MRKKVCKKIIVVLLLFIFAAGGLNSNFNILNPRLFTAIPCEVAEIHVITVF